MSRPTSVNPQHLDVLRRALLTRRVGTVLSVDTIRPELEAAQVPQAVLGALFRTACLRGWLTPTGTVTPSRYRPARGRLVREYRRQPIAAKQQQGRAA